MRLRAQDARQRPGTGQRVELSSYTQLSLQSLRAGHGLWPARPVPRSGTLDDDCRLGRDIGPGGFLLCTRGILLCSPSLRHWYRWATRMATAAANEIIEPMPSAERRVAVGEALTPAGRGRSKAAAACSRSTDRSDRSSLPKAGANRGALQNGPSARDVDLRLRVSGTQPAGDSCCVYRQPPEQRQRVPLEADLQRQRHAGRTCQQVHQRCRNVACSAGHGPGPDPEAGAFFNLRSLVTGANPTTIRSRRGPWRGEPSAGSSQRRARPHSCRARAPLGLRMYLNTHGHKRAGNAVVRRPVGRIARPANAAGGRFQLGRGRGLVDGQLHRHLDRSRRRRGRGTSATARAQRRRTRATATPSRGTYTVYARPRPTPAARTRTVTLLTWSNRRRRHRRRCRGGHLRAHQRPPAGGLPRGRLYSYSGTTSDFAATVRRGPCGCHLPARLAPRSSSVRW